MLREWRWGAALVIGGLYCSEVSAETETAETKTAETKTVQPKPGETEAEAHPIETEAPPAVERSPRVPPTPRALSFEVSEVGPENDHLEIGANLALRVPFTEPGDWWGGIQFSAQGCLAAVPYLSLGAALAILTGGTANVKDPLFANDSGVRRDDTTTSLDVYLRAHLPYDFPISPYIGAGAGPRLTKSSYTVAGAKDDRVELDSRYNWALEFNFGGGLEFFVSKKRYEGALINLGLALGGAFGNATVSGTRSVTTDRYLFPHQTLFMTLGIAGRF